MNVRLAPVVGDAPFREVSLLVDTGATHSILSRQVLNEMGAIPSEHTDFLLANGQTVERDIGWVRIAVDGRTAYTPVVFGEASDQTVLGAIALETLGLQADPVNKRLTPAPRYLLFVNQTRPDRTRLSYPGRDAPPSRRRAAAMTTHRRHVRLAEIHGPSRGEVAGVWRGLALVAVLAFTGCAKVSTEDIQEAATGIGNNGFSKSSSGGAPALALPLQAPAGATQQIPTATFNGPGGGHMQVSGSVTVNIGYDSKNFPNSSYSTLQMTITSTDYTIVTKSGHNVVVNGAPYLTMTGLLTSYASTGWLANGYFQLGGAFNISLKDSPSTNETVNVRLNWNVTNNRLSSISGTIGDTSYSQTF